MIWTILVESFSKTIIEGLVGGKVSSDKPFDQLYRIIPALHLERSPSQASNFFSSSICIWLAWNTETRSNQAHVVGELLRPHPLSSCFNSAHSFTTAALCRILNANFSYFRAEDVWLLCSAVLLQAWHNVRGLTVAPAGCSVFFFYFVLQHQQCTLVTTNPHFHFGTLLQN